MIPVRIIKNDEETFQWQSNYAVDYISVFSVRLILDTKCCCHLPRVLLFKVNNQIDTMWVYFLLSLLATCDSVAASSDFDFGDTLALILGLIIGIVGFFACIGAYARRRNHFDSLWSCSDPHTSQVGCDIRGGCTSAECFSDVDNDACKFQLVYKMIYNDLLGRNCLRHFYFAPNIG